MDDPSMSGVTIAIESPGDTDGLEIIDPIERRRYTLYTSDPVAPVAADPDEFRVPVETAVEIETDAISFPTLELLYVRDDAGNMIAELEPGMAESFPDGTYSLEPSGLIKIYVRIDEAFDVHADVGNTTIEFDGPTAVQVGSRSLHERPATTVTITDDPEGVLAAISTFGSALKTTSPERSFPTLRGHPPAVELAETRSIPDALEPPTEDVWIEVPAAYEYAYPIAPLSYYLGVPVEVGSDPRIVGDGIDYSLDRGDSFEACVERTLKRTFLLDCVTRTEGLYQVDLHERHVVEPRLDLQFDELYDAPLADRLRAFLAVDHAAVEDVIPDWKLATHVDADPENIEALPYLAGDLAVVKIADGDPVSREAIESGTTQAFVRGSATSQRGTAIEDTTFVEPTKRVNALEEAWVGEGTPLAATQTVTEAYRNRIGRSPSTGSIDISVICNAAAMADERDVVDDVYGSRADLPFEVTVHRNTTTAELAALLAEPREFVHYIGHIDENGVRCEDGRLDASTLDEIAVDAFFLNACQSYEQGMELIRAGAIGGIVTLSDVVNYGAIRIGRTVARLLNCGFPLRAALDVARGESVIGSQYIVVGDGSLSIVQPESGTPQMYEIDDHGERFDVRVEAFGAEPGMGCMFLPYIGDNDRHYLASGSTGWFDVEIDDFREYLGLENVPVRVDETLSWSYEVLADSL